MYILRPVSSCVGDGSYDSGAPSQAGSRDPEIAASVNACFAQAVICKKGRDRIVEFPQAGVSGMGCSQEAATDDARNNAGSTLYRVSKAALNAVVKAISLELASRGVTAIALHPGWVKTDMGGAGADIDAATSVAGMRAVIEGAESRVSGHFFDYTGKEIPW